MEGIQVIGFDADDTLWVNETYFLETEQKLRLLLAPYVDGETVSTELFRTESRNMPLYGYGVKAYILSVLETAIRITGGKVPASVLEQILALGKEQLTKPVRTAGWSGGDTECVGWPLPSDCCDQRRPARPGAETAPLRYRASFPSRRDHER